MDSVTEQALRLKLDQMRYELQKHRQLAPLDHRDVLPTLKAKLVELSAASESTRVTVVTPFVLPLSGSDGKPYLARNRDTSARLLTLYDDLLSPSVNRRLENELEDMDLYKETTLDSEDPPQIVLEEFYLDNTKSIRIKDRITFYNGLSG